MQPASSAAATAMTTSSRISVAFLLRRRYTCCAAARCLRRWRRLGCLASALGELIEEIEKQRDVQHRQRRLADHAADDARADRMARIGARSHRNRARQAADR